MSKQEHLISAEKLQKWIDQNEREHYDVRDVFSALSTALEKGTFNPDPVPTIKPGDKVNYHVTTHITSAITSGCDCKDLEDVKNYIEEELFQAKHKGKESINITISSLEVVKDE